MERELRDSLGLAPDGPEIVAAQGAGSSVLGMDAAGRCLFFEPAAGNLCAIHRRLGHGALPAACRHFPRVSLLSPASTTVVLSHYCPTAARLLMEAPEPPRVLTEPSASDAYEGLDARAALPPLLRPGVLMDWESYALWEEHAVDVLGRSSPSAEAALGVLGLEVEVLRAWKPDDGPLGALVADVVGRPAARFPGDAEAGLDADLVLARAVLSAVPPGIDAPRLHPDPHRSWARWMAPSWESLSFLLGRYLATKVWGSWIALQGRGLRTTLTAVRAAAALVRLYGTAGSERAGRSFDAVLLRDAVRTADLLLVHLARPDRLAQALDAEDAVGSGATSRAARRRASASPGPRTA